jgi:heme oxygenase (biliverdin-IX-beta and delta-forming)
VGRVAIHPSRLTSDFSIQERTDPLVEKARSSIHAELRRRTAFVHRQLEDQLDLLGPSLSTRRYRLVLEAFYGFYDPLETGLARLAPSSPPLTFPLATRTVLLEHDLVALGASPRRMPELPRCSDLPALTRSEHLAGCLYVLEGACLGGQVIARALARNLGMTKDSGAAFFFGDGERTIGRWHRVLGWLDGFGSSTASTEGIVVSACETFRALGRWTQMQGASR